MAPKSKDAAEATLKKRGKKSERTNDEEAPNQEASARSTADTETPGPATPQNESAPEPAHTSEESDAERDTIDLTGFDPGVAVVGSIEEDHAGSDAPDDLVDGEVPMGELADEDAVGTIGDELGEALDAAKELAEAAVLAEELGELADAVELTDHLGGNEELPYVDVLGSGDGAASQGTADGGGAVAKGSDGSYVRYAGDTRTYGAGNRNEQIGADGGDVRVDVSGETSTVRTGNTTDGFEHTFSIDKDGKITNSDASVVTPTPEASGGTITETDSARTFMTQDDTKGVHIDGNGDFTSVRTVPGEDDAPDKVIVQTGNVTDGIDHQVVVEGGKITKAETLGSDGVWRMDDGSAYGSANGISYDEKIVNGDGTTTFQNSQTGATRTQDDQGTFTFTNNKGGQEETRERDPHTGERTYQTTNPNGDETTIMMDSGGNVTEITTLAADGTRTDQHFFDDGSSVVETINPDGSIDVDTFDAEGHQTSHGHVGPGERLTPEMQKQLDAVEAAGQEAMTPESRQTADSQQQSSTGGQSDSPNGGQSDKEQEQKKQEGGSETGSGDTGSSDTEEDDSEDQKAEDTSGSEGSEGSEGSGEGEDTEEETASQPAPDDGGQGTGPDGGVEQTPTTEMEDIFGEDPRMLEFWSNPSNAMVAQPGAGETVPTGQDPREHIDDTTPEVGLPSYALPKTEIPDPFSLVSQPGEHETEDLGAAKDLLQAMKEGEDSVINPSDDLMVADGSAGAASAAPIGDLPTIDGATTMESGAPAPTPATPELATGATTDADDGVLAPLADAGMAAAVETAPAPTPATPEPATGDTADAADIGVLAPLADAGLASAVIEPAPSTGAALGDTLAPLADAGFAMPAIADSLASATPEPAAEPAEADVGEPEPAAEPAVLAPTAGFDASGAVGIGDALAPTSLATSTLGDSTPFSDAIGGDDLALGDDSPFEDIGE